MKSGFSFSSKALFPRVLIAALSMSFSLTGCAPEPVQRTFPQPNVDFGPKRTDGSLQLAEVAMLGGPGSAAIRWKGDIETASWLRAADDLSWLSR
ncbi:MAG: hypothetical protein RBT63_03560, partial [Bdellovibrionales bacterium]|nr:hypothetical protein [Bdellovibrionales bacterium]